jgi:putative tryptophan/tyrosine transport system substrate-binding protein
MKRDKPPYLRDYELKRWGELSLRYFAKQCAEEAKTLERAAAIARDKASWFLAAANAKATVYRVGMLTGQPEADPENASRLAAFRQALGKFGWLEGQNLQIDIRWGAGDPGRMRVLAKELSGLAPDIVVAESTPATAALRQEMPNVPIVFSQVANPVGAGFAASLARPGGNITGSH